MDDILAARGVSLRFGGVRALTEVNFGVREGELFSIIGPNGAGKTSMVNCISGRYRPSEGKLIYRGRDITPLNPNARASLGIGLRSLRSACCSRPARTAPILARGLVLEKTNL